jgi:hypothetical protein
MPRSSAIQSRKESDAYATRAVLIALLNALKQTNPTLLVQIGEGVEYASLSPGDVPAPDPLILEAAYMILQAAS